MSLDFIKDISDEVLLISQLMTKDGLIPPSGQKENRDVCFHLFNSVQIEQIIWQMGSQMQK